MTRHAGPPTGPFVGRVSFVMGGGTQNGHKMLEAGDLLFAATTLTLTESEENDAIDRNCRFAQCGEIYVV